LAGLRVLVVDGASNRGGLFTSYPTPPTGLAPVGLGSLQRVSSLADVQAFAGMRAAGSAEPGALEEPFAEPPEQLFDPYRWVQANFRRPELPRAGWMLAWLVLYVFFVGPLSFLALRARDHREKAWIVLPLGALAGAALLFAWVRVHAFRAVELDAARCVFSRDGLEDRRTQVFLRIASPSERSYRLQVAGAW